MAQLRETHDRMTARTAAQRTPPRLAQAAGWCALAFAVLVIGQNVVRGATAPAIDAQASEVVDYFLENPGITRGLAVSLAIGIAVLVVFAVGLWCTLDSARARPPATIGLVGVVIAVALFSALFATEVAMSVVAGTGADESLVDALWAFHNALFGMNLMALALALAGLSMGAVAGGLLPGWFRYLGWTGAALLAAGASQTPAIADGSSLIALGYAGFVCWLVFVAGAGLALLRSSAPGDRAAAAAP